MIIAGLIVAQTAVESEIWIAPGIYLHK